MRCWPLPRAAQAMLRLYLDEDAVLLLELYK
jgi:hypothetical protein